MKSPKPNQMFVLTVLLLFSFLALIAYGQATNWEVPKKYKRMSNPFADNTEDVFIGKAVYKKHCYSCHGGSGIGNGPEASKLKTPVGNFSKSEFQSQSDGALYYKIIFGRGEMPAYEKKIRSEEDRWQLINYLRTFKR